MSTLSMIKMNTFLMHWFSPFRQQFKNEQISLTNLLPSYWRMLHNFMPFILIKGFSMQFILNTSLVCLFSISTLLMNSCGSDEQIGPREFPISAQVNSYTQTCRNVEWSGSTLNAACRRRDGNYMRTFLTNASTCKDISNDNGALKCIGW